MTAIRSILMGASGVGLFAVLTACGGPTANVNGLAIDADGDLVVAYGGFNRIRVVDRETGETVRDVEDGVRVPDDVETGPDGRIWWTGLLSGEIGTIDVEGSSQILADIGTGANGIALAPDGRLVVGRCGLGFGDELFALDPIEPSEPVVLIDDLAPGCSLNGMLFGPDGRLFGAQPTLGRVVAVDLETQRVDVLVDGLGPESYAVALSPGGEVFALDGERVVRVVDGEATTFVELPDRGDNLVFAPDGELFVSTGPAMQVLGIDETGEMRVLLDGAP